MFHSKAAAPTFTSSAVFKSVHTNIENYFKNQEKKKNCTTFVCTCVWRAKCRSMTAKVVLSTWLSPQFSEFISFFFFLSKYFLSLFYLLPLGLVLNKTVSL